MSKHRHIIMHYHLFKNAGTSIDHTLKKNFKQSWREHEDSNTGWSTIDIANYLKENQDIVVLSSHTALLPLPVLPNTTIYPIIFIRHPIDRIRSVYEFEHKQIADTEGAIMAKKVDMAGYIEWRLSRNNDRSIRNFQSYRLAFATPKLLNGKQLSEYEQALSAVNELDFVGLVDEFDISLRKMQKWLKNVFPNINFKPVEKNVTKKDTNLNERLDMMRKKIGASLYDDIVEANKSDLKIYKKLKKV